MSTRESNLRSFGFSLLALAISLGGLARGLHLSESIALAMNGASIACSLGAMALFVKARPNRRASVIAMLVAAVVMAGVTFALVA